MARHLQVLPDGSLRNTLVVSNELKQRLALADDVVMKMAFGWHRKEVLVRGRELVDGAQVLLSYQVIADLGIPLSPGYELTVCGQQLILGPYIGILATKSESELDETVEVLTNYLYDYQSIGGAVVAFSAEGVNQDDQLLSGYLFNPQTSRWEKGEYAYPSVIFRRVGMNRTLREHFASYLGNKVFNSYHFNKWEMYQWLSKDPEIDCYLPETILYQRPGDIHFFLTRYPKIYIKPIGGSQGTGITEVTSAGRAIFVRYRDSELNHECLFTTRQDANIFFRKILSKGDYILQQAINLLSTGERLTDFRLTLVKNGLGLWEDVGLVARYGTPQSIVSNVSAQGQAEMGEIALRKLFGLPTREVRKMRAVMSEVATNAAKHLENCGLLLGNLGFDFGVDNNRRIWIIEINNKDPNHTILIDAGNRPLFYYAKRLNMLYARYLSGFK